MTDKAINTIEKKTTAEDYSRLERNSVNREISDSKSTTKPTSGRTHSLIVTNTTISVGSRLSGQSCEIYAGNMCVRLASGRMCYPSVVVVCGKPSFANSEADTLLNPTVIFEIFSAENRPHQRIENYLAMDSVKECLLVKENKMHIEHFSKQNSKQWIYKIYTERTETISLESINCKTSVSEIYSQINFADNGVRQAIA
jgi:Uma2 family endonuclease